MEWFLIYDQVYNIESGLPELDLALYQTSTITDKKQLLEKSALWQTMQFLHHVFSVLKK